MGRVTKGRPLSCAVNPATGRERFYRLEPAATPKRVVVVGGGPAGLGAARVASLRGHKVTLFEKSNSLGGHLLEASVPDLYLIGDSRKPQNIMNAVWDAYEVARMI